MDSTSMKAYFDNICVQFEGFKVDMLKRDLEIKELRDEIVIRRRAQETQVEVINEKEKHIQSLQQDISRLKEDNAAFSKVSHIIAMEKENSKLRSEVEMLTKRLSRSRPPPQITESEHTLPGNLPNLCLNAGVWCMESVVTVPIQEKEPEPVTYQITESEKTLPGNLSNSAESTVPLQEPEEEGESFYIKRIKGVDYYISEMTSYIYKKEGDEEVGDKVGRLEKTEGNKSKVVWIKET